MPWCRGGILHPTNHLSAICRAHKSSNDFRRLSLLERGNRYDPRVPPPGWVVMQVPPAPVPAPPPMPGAFPQQVNPPPLPAHDIDHVHNIIVMLNAYAGIGMQQLHDIVRFIPNGIAILAGAKTILWSALGVWILWRFVYRADFQHAEDFRARELGVPSNNINVENLILALMWIVLALL